MAVGDAVDVKVRKGEILIRPVKQVRGKYRLQELVAGMPGNYKPDP